MTTTHQLDGSTGVNWRVPSVGADLYRGTHQDLCIVTPEMARQMRQTMHFERQRKLRVDNIIRLAVEMEAGRFIEGTQIYICVLSSGARLIINGNHTLEAVDLSGVPQLLSLVYKPVANVEDAARIYAVFDNQKPRTWTDSLKALGKQDAIPEASKMMSAVNCIANGFDQFSSHPPSRIERIDLLDEYKEAVQGFHANCIGADRDIKGLLRRSAVLAVALATFRYQPSLAEEFWGTIAKGKAVSGDPGYALLRWLRNTPTAAGIGSRAEHAKAAGLAWNAAFDERSLSFVKPGQANRFTLLGTPWEKGVKPPKAAMAKAITKQLERYESAREQRAHP